MADRSVSVPMILSDRERRDAKGQTFLENLRNYSPTVWPRTTKFGMITLVGERHVSGESNTPHPKRVRPSVPNFWEPY